ncbi:MAG: glycosyltransferase family 4 protein [Alphaproteobacteria bacterium]|nr:glycosyltransferase family 4 protein [Alphaproteobacteria bacterium]MBV9694218.1 glycosyltransferase family 4 protein [Alphaproteobacteria bacterium]
MPERNAPAIRTHAHCKRWVEAGVAVTVVTSVPNFPAGVVLAPYRNRLLQRERIDGIDVVRVWTYLAPNEGRWRRMLDFASFGVGGFLAGLWQKADVIVATSPQLLAGAAGGMLGWVRRKPWLLEVRDLWPDSVVALGMMSETSPAVRLLRRLEKRLYRSAARIVTTNDGLRARLIARGIPAVKIGVVPNGVDRSQFSPRPAPQRLLDLYNLGGRFVVGYIGTQGLAHDMESVIAAAERLRGSEVVFFLVGEGARHHGLVKQVRQKKLDNVRLVRSVPASEVPDHIACCNAVLVPLRHSATLPDTMPSKIFELAAMEKPIVIGAEGIAADLIRSRHAGLAVPPEDADALLAAILRLKDEAGLADTLRAGARALAAEYSRDAFAARMLDEIKLAAKIHKPPASA